MKHLNYNSEILSKNTSKHKSITKDNSGNENDIDICGSKTFFRNDKRNKLYYFKNIMNYPKYGLESYQSNLNESLNNNLEKLLNESHIEVVKLPPTNLKENNSKLISVSQASTNSNLESLLSVRKPKNRAIISKIPLNDLDAYYNQLYQSNNNSIDNNGNQFHYQYKNENTLSPYNTLGNKNANSERQSNPKLKKISTRVLLLKEQQTSSNQTFIPSITNYNTKIFPDKTEEGRLSSNAIKRMSKFKNKNNEDDQKTLSLVKNSNNTSVDQSISKSINTNNNHKLQENLKSIKCRLQNQITQIIKNSTENPVDHNEFTQLENTKGSDYSKAIIEKIKIINNFLSTQTEDKIRSKKLRHRKIFVIINGQVILTKTKIDGAYIEIPTQRYLNFLETKKERMVKYYEFLAECQRVFNKTIPFKNVFLLNGINVFDLNEISQNEKAVYVSMSTSFFGIHLFKPRVTDITEADYNLLQLNEYKVDRNKKKNPFRFLLRRKTQKKIQPIKVFKTVVKKKKFLKEQSFTFGKDCEELETEEFFYYSDNEKRSREHARELGDNYKTLIDQVLYFHEKEKKEKINEIRSKEYKKLMKKLKRRVNEHTKEGLDKLIIKYNVDRGKKYSINMEHQTNLIENQNQEEEFTQTTRGLGLGLIKQLRIFREYKHINIILDENEFYKKELEGDVLESFINKNIKRTYDITPVADRDIQRFLPDLVSLNIPRVLKSFPKLQRRECYDIFIQYKLLLVICVCISCNLKLINKGIDFETFFHCNPLIRKQGACIAEKIFNTLNVLDMKYIDWEEYMKGMLKMKSKSLSDKIDMFFKVIDTDSNGYLSFEEVYNLSIISLSRSLGSDEKDEVIQMLASYFTNLIFQLVEMPVNEEIPYSRIKEKIIEGKTAAGYLEMLICADTFM